MLPPSTFFTTRTMPVFRDEIAGPIPKLPGYLGWLLAGLAFYLLVWPLMFLQEVIGYAIPAAMPIPQGESGWFFGICAIGGFLAGRLFGKLWHVSARWTVMLLPLLLLLEEAIGFYSQPSPVRSVYDNFLSNQCSSSESLYVAFATAPFLLAVGFGSAAAS